MAAQTRTWTLLLRFRHFPLVFCSFFIFHVSLTQSTTQNPNYIIPARSPANCKRGTDDNFHEYFDKSKLNCVQCAQNSSIQTVAADGLSCKCRPEYKLTLDHGAGQIACEACPPHMVASSDGWTCVACSPPSSPDGTCPECDSASLEADRDLDGTLLTNNMSIPERACIACTSETSPDTNTQRCARCNSELRVRSDCNCPKALKTGGLCFRVESDLEPDYKELYEIDFESAKEFRSHYFRQNVRAAHGACAPSWANLTACQQLANLCVLLLYDLRRAPPSQALCNGGTPCNDACSLYLRLGGDFPGNRVPPYNVSNPRIPEWRVTMAWLFYPPTSRADPRADTSIPTTFGRDSALNLIVAQYDVGGSFLGYSDVWKNEVSLCRTSTEEPIVFGVEFKKECYLYVDEMLNNTNAQHMTFYELTDGEERYYAIPILVKNLRDKSGNQPNKGTNTERWQFVRRFFLMDTVVGRTELGRPPTVVRYLASLKLHVTMREGTEAAGLIYVPWVEAEYKEVHQNQYGKGEKVLVTSEVVYSVNLARHSSNLGIAVGVLSGLALFYSAFQSHNFNRRQGNLAIDFQTILYFVLHLCGTLSNVFLVVMLGTSIWWLLLYKATMLVIPTLEGDYYIRAFLGSAFALKILNVLYLLVSQTTIDMFFLDWERSASPDANLHQSERRPGKSGVSIWRTYFVANEWNELSTLRSVNMAALLLLVTLLLKGVGLENLAHLEPGSRLIPNPQGGDDVVFSRSLRFAISGSVYIGLALLLWILYNTLWRSLVSDRLSAFRDVCSMCNVSAFLMTHDQFGYYVHGRSVHGTGDGGLRDLYVNLNREELDMCGERGLEPGTSHQTFEVALPKRLRQEYNKVLLPVKRARAQQRLRSRLGDDCESRLLAYDVLNKFLQNFIDHNLRDIDYVITEKNLLEKVLDTEIEDNRDLGYFYVDQGQSFDRTMLYGHEMTLQSLYLLFFTMVDLVSTNFVLAATLTYVLDKVICHARYAFGRRNIAAKTMVDQRLLI